MTYGDGTHVESDDPNVTAAAKLRDDFTKTYVANKDGLDYDDLCTLESLLSYFKHDVSLDIEIAALKEEALLSQCNDLKAEIDFMKADDVPCSMKNCNADEDFYNAVSDALMLMSYINPADLPEDDHKRNKIISDAMIRPHTLLTYVPEDIKESVFKGMEDD